MINYNNISKITKFLLNKIHMIKLKYKNILKNQFKICMFKIKNHNHQIKNCIGHNHFLWLKTTSCRSNKIPSKFNGKDDKIQLSFHDHNHSVHNHHEGI